MQPAHSGAVPAPLPTVPRLETNLPGAAGSPLTLVLPKTSPPQMTLEVPLIEVMLQIPPRQDRPIVHPTLPPTLLRELQETKQPRSLVSLIVGTTTTLF